MAEAVETCVHCGFCLPTCPTYVQLGQEADSPRGRIVLMKQVLEGDLKPEQVEQHIDQCLGCLACETACPSGVKYRDLISPYRAMHPRKKSITEKFRNWLVSATLPYPGRFRWALRLGMWTRFLQFLTPSAIRPMTELIPESIPPAEKLKASNPPLTSKKCHVALLAGCAQQVLMPQINRLTIELLTRCGAEVSVPPDQGCCGALSWHSGDDQLTRKLAQKNLPVFAGDYDWIVTNAAGCGSGMHEYGLVFAGTDQQSAAEELASKVIDVSVLLDQLGFANVVEPFSAGPPVKVAYHDACHLSNGQHVTTQPRRLLKSLPNVDVVEIKQSELCCGSAGTYNINQPKIAGELGQKKAQAVIDTGAEVMVTGNIGCIVQVQKHLKALGSKIRVMHLVEFLADYVADKSSDTVSESQNDTTFFHPDDLSQRRSFD